MAMLFVAIVASLILIFGVSIYKWVRTRIWANALQQQQQGGPLPVYNRPERGHAWFNPSLIVQMALFAFIFWSFRNIQNAVPWNDISWAFLAPAVIMGLGYLSWRFFSAEIPLIEGAPPTPPALLILRKVALINVAFVLVGFLVIRAISKGLETWPVLQKGVDDTGLGRFFGGYVDDPLVAIAFFVALFIVIYGTTNTITRPEILGPGGKSVLPGDLNPGSVRTSPTAAASSAVAGSVARSSDYYLRPNPFFVVVVVGILLAFGVAVIYASDFSLTGYIDEKIRPGGAWSPAPQPMNRPSVAPASIPCRQKTDYVGDMRNPPISYTVCKFPDGYWYREDAHGNWVRANL